MPTHPLRLGAAACVALLVLPGLLSAQSRYSPAPTIEPVIEALDRMRPASSAGFRIKNVTLIRETATFQLNDGTVWPLTEVSGRVVGAVWRGTGRMTFVVPEAVEKERMRFYLGAEGIDGGISELVLLFTDSTLAQFRAGRTDESAADPGDAVDRVARGRDFLKTFKDRTWEPSFLEPVLNGRENGYFFALVDRRDGEDVVFQFDPEAPEAVSLSVQAQSPGADIDPEVVTSFAAPSRPAPTRDARRRQAEIERYVIDVDMPQATDGGVQFSAVVDAHLRAPRGGVGPWLPFFLYPELDVDSARWNDVTVPVYKNNDAYYLWVRAAAPLSDGTTAVLHLSYHGSLLDRFGDWFVLKSSIGWYPSPVDGLSKAAFDITYHTPVGHPIGSIGRLVDSSVTGRTVTTHWVHEAPMRNASFNIGRFQGYEIGGNGSPPVTLLWSDAGHRALSTGMRIPTQGNVKQVMTDEVAAALRFFTNVYGPPEEPRFFVTEIPGDHGEAFPGLIHLSYYTFTGTDETGYDQSFRAHEVAHQWWGIGVDYASYRDRWLSEGLADFSGIWYLQTRRGNMEKYLGMLREWRGNLIAARGRTGAISLGARTGTGRDPRYYSYVVYNKGAWTMRMLRILLLQLSTMNEDKFTNAMREFYTTYHGRSASTEDLRHVMEKYAGTDLKWFFDQWIDGTGIPTYHWAWQTEPTAAGTRVKIRVRQSNVPDTFQMYVPVTVTLKDGRTLRTRVRVAGPLTETALGPVPGEVKEVKFNDLEGVLAEVSSEGW